MNWKYKIKSGSALREAIDNEDMEQVVEYLLSCCVELNEKLRGEDRITYGLDLDDMFIALNCYEPSEDDYIEESRYYDHWFTNSIADYVDENTDREGDIEWLKECFDNEGLSFGTDDGGEYFIVEDKSKFFANSFKEFKKALKELSKITLDDFITDKVDIQMYVLESTYYNKFGFYVDNDDTGVETFDECVRRSSNGTKYYIGATIDYHF